MSLEIAAGAAFFALLGMMYVACFKRDTVVSLLTKEPGEDEVED